MRMIGACCVIAFALALPARGDATYHLTQPVINTLTPIDSLPSSQQINSAFNNSPAEALANLQQIANPTSFVDRGVQIRAVRALIHYCASTTCSESEPAHQTLVQIATRYGAARSGSELLVLRAAIESLGILRVTTDVDLLASQLQHPSRDIRTAAARALRDLRNTQAIVPLRARYNVEDTDQVKIAISDALRVLGQPVP